MEHTHLVKGLDFALLAKIRADLDAKQQATEIQRSSDKTQGPASLLGLEVKTPLGRFMRNVFLADGKEQKNKLDLFLPGRTTFSFDLDDDFGSEIPTTVSRSIDDLPYSTRDKKTAVINKTILSSISTIMDYIRQGSRPVAKKMKKKEKDDVKKPIAAAQAPRPAAVPEDDIFDDAGSYDLTMRAAASAANGHHGARR
jgi:IK cytokine